MFTKTIKKIISKFPISFLNGKRFIFCYHDISSPKEAHHAPQHYSTTIEAFKEQIQFFKANCNLVSLEDIVLTENLPKNKVHVSITFDDGFYSVLQNAHPILKKEGIPYSLFVNKEAITNNQLWVSNLILHSGNTSYLSKVYENCLPFDLRKEDFLANPLQYISRFIFHEKAAEALRITDATLPKTYLNIEELKTLKNEGVSIGNHTQHHFVLSECSPALQMEEIRGNAHFLKEAIGDVNPFFAIPFGKKEHFNSNTISISTDSGHTHHLNTNVNSYKKGDTLVPRLVLTNESINDVIFYMNRTLFKTYDL
jgi:peptidoglycan/xylan/chitin deacetylase (PgdA/CDA1 family)